MSLSRLPQVALRRLVPAVTSVPKSLDDEQLKKMHESQLSMKALSKSFETGGSSGLIAALAKSAGSGVPASVSMMMNRSAQGVLSSQDLALVRAASSSDGPGRRGLAKDGKPGAKSLVYEGSTGPRTLVYEGAAGPRGLVNEDATQPRALTEDTSSVDALVTALRGTAAISSARVSAEPSDAEDAMDASERRKEQNRRAQKKFREKDKVRQKQVKWRASQYDTLVESNKRFKRDIDIVSRERDQYRRILESHGISVGSVEQDTKISVAPEPVAALPDVSVSPTTTMASPVVSPLGMDEAVRDAFGPWMPSQPTATMDDLLGSLMFGAVHDPMFALPGPVTEPTLGSNDLWLGSLQESEMLVPLESDPLLVGPPLVVDQSAMFAPHGTLDSQFVDPTAFIDELLSSPAYTSESGSSTSRKRSYADAML
ncbi:hypothetical protein GGH96_004980 [Coemansia sp. RSA 1972]|nr:hypothetical protein GGH96_004980 [Coemansia sp. RSA 1972]